MKVEPQKEHEWLHKLVGDWTYETEAAMGPGQDPSKFTGTESVRSLGGLWVVCEGRGVMGGDEATTIMTLGYDPQKGRYVGSWVGSMMTHLWVYDGSVDAAGRVLTLDTEGPSFPGSAKPTARYQDVIEFISDDHRVLTARTLGDDGAWNQFMTTHYRRVPRKSE